jgi:hypothetical protein
MINLSMKIFGELPAGLLQGEYEDFSSMWYIDVGSQILLAMILEIAAPHCIPICQMVMYGSRR